MGLLKMDADRMMTAASVARGGLRIIFADGCKGLFPFSLIPEIYTAADVADIELPTSYELVIRTGAGEVIEIRMLANKATSATMSERRRMTLKRRSAPRLALVHQRLELFLAGDVAGLRQHIEPEAGEFGFCLLAGLGLAAAEGNLRARARKLLGDRLAYAARSAGDERDPAAQVEKGLAHRCSAI